MRSRRFSASSIPPGAISLPGALLILLLAASVGAPPVAAWLIEPEQYHTSAHGTFTCLECHGDIPGQTPHPDPRHVNQRPIRPERLDACMACHDQVVDDLDSGFHGTLTVDAPEDYQDCLACHDPHYQRTAGMETRLDPARPRTEWCSACHVARDALPAPADTDGAGGRCMACHQTPDLSRPAEHARVQAFCFHCHGADAIPAGETLSPQGVFIHPEDYRATSHADLACLTCHPQAARYGHTPQTVETCRSCHSAHDEKKAHDAHLRVACEACHLPDAQPIHDPASGRIAALRETRRGEISGVHAFMAQKDLDSCRSCHFAGNTVGAAAMILPPKSIICMPCHAGTFSAGDGVTVLTLLVFGVGMLLVFSYVLSGSLPGKPTAGAVEKIGTMLGAIPSTLFSRRLPHLVVTLFWDVLLQRRLYRRSRLRWLVHSLIFFPFVIRFTWGLIALLASLWYPHWETTWALLDKNHPATAFIFDLTGLMILAGVFWAFLRDREARRHQPGDLAPQDRLALLLIGMLVMVGFLLEGARITMTGHPPGAEWAFIGNLLSGLFSPGKALTALYGYLWYLHAILGGGFIAYLPFSRLLHIILAPIALGLQSVTDHDHKEIKHE